MGTSVSTIRRVLAGALAAASLLAAAVGLSVSSLAAVAPGGLSHTASDVSLVAFGPHGTVKNRSNFDIKITKSWCASRSKPCSNADITTLKPGHTSSGDIDGYEVPPGKKYSILYDEFAGSDRHCVGPGWHKINDTIVAKVDRTC